MTFLIVEKFRVIILIILIKAYEYINAKLNVKLKPSMMNIYSQFLLPIHIHHFLFKSILKFRKSILKLLEKFKKKKLVMTWLLMWLNGSVITLNSTSQLLDMSCGGQLIPCVQTALEKAGPNI